MHILLTEDEIAQSLADKLQRTWGIPAALEFWLGITLLLNVFLRWPWRDEKQMASSDLYRSQIGGSYF